MHNYLIRRVSRGGLLILWAFAIGGFIYWNCDRLYQSLGPPASDDFKRFWAAANLFAQGENPYDLALLSRFSENAGQGQLKPLPFYYPPFTFSALLPLSFFSFQTARILYLAILATSFLGYFVYPLFRKLYLPSQDHQRLAETVLSVTVLATFLPFWVLWYDGGLTLFPFLGILGFILAGRISSSSGRAWCQGLALSILLVKPSVCFLVLPFIFTLWIKTKEFRGALGFFVGAVALLLPASFLLPVTIFDFLRVSQSLPDPMLWKVPTLSSYLQHSFSLPPHYRWLIAIVGVCLAVWLGWRRRSNSESYETLNRTIIPLSLVTVPYAWTYDFFLLLFPINSLIRHRLERSAHFTLSPTRNRLVLLLFVNLLLAAIPLEMRRHWWYPLAVMIICAYGAGSTPPTANQTAPRNGGS